MFSTRSYLSVLTVVLLSAFGSTVFAAGSGQVQQLSGTLSAQRADGSVRILSQKSEVSPGDVLTTQRDSYVQINFTDGSSMTMRPNTQMKLEAYQFDESKPQEDSAFFRLIKGGLRTVTGLVGKRGNQDAYRIGTATATIGIRGSSGETLDCTGAQSCDGVVAGGGSMAPGIYQITFTGTYVMRFGREEPDAAQKPGGSEIIVPEGQLGFLRSGASTFEILPKEPAGVNLKDLPLLNANLSFLQGLSCAIN